MKKTDTKKNAVNMVERFELNEQEMNQIVGGTTYLMEGTPMSDTTAATSDPGDFGCDIVLACDQSCKTCITSSISFNICKTRFKFK